MDTGSQMHPVAASIRNVVQEEMLHMALACNMLTALGCVPKINDPRMVPSYPGRIPGGVHPELTVSLSGLSDASLDVFIAIEAPSVGGRPKTPEKGKGYKTIGAFYQAILGSFQMLNPELSIDRQVTGPLAYIVMADLPAVEAAIALIMAQGEGSEASPEVEYTHELAHYYRFLEVKHRKQFSGIDRKGRALFEGEPFEFPATWPMAVVPKGGYLQEDVPADVWRMINDFDQTFTQLLDRLQSVWEHGLLNRDDQSNLQYGIRKLLNAGVIEKAGKSDSKKGVTYVATALGCQITDSFAAFRRELLIGLTESMSTDIYLADVARVLNLMSGIYDQASCIAAAHRVTG